MHAVKKGGLKGGSKGGGGGGAMSDLRSFNHNGPNSRGKRRRTGIFRFVEMGGCCWVQEVQVWEEKENNNNNNNDGNNNAADFWHATILMRKKDKNKKGVWGGETTIHILK